MNITLHRTIVRAGALTITLVCLNSWASDPLPDINVAGSDEWVNVTDSDIFPVTVALDAGDLDGQEVEMWLVAGTSEGNFSFIPGSGWVQGLQPSWQGEALSFDKFETWNNIPPFGAGEYWIGFAVDDTVNGLLDTTWTDLAAIEVQSTPGWEIAIGGIGEQLEGNVMQTLSGGFLVTGWNLGSPYLIETDAEGTVLWTKTLNFQGDIVSTQQTADGGYIMTGYVNSGAGEASGLSAQDVVLARLDTQGELLWTKTFGGNDWDSGYTVRQTPDDGYIIGGVTSSFGAGSVDFFLIKTDAAGEMTWYQTYGGFSSEYLGAVELTSDGGYVLVGDTFSFGVGGDVYLVRTDAQGEMLWEKNFGNTNFEWAEAVQQTDDGGFIIGGTRVNSTVEVSSDDTDVYLIKTDPQGEMEWEQTFGGTKDENGSAVLQTADGGYLVAGDTDSFGAGGTDAYVVKTLGDGEAEWTKVFGGREDDWVRSIIETDDAGYLFAGSSFSFGQGDGDIYLIKVDAAE